MQLVWELIPTTIYNLVIEGLNKRLDNPGCVDLPCIATVAAGLNMDIQDVIALPEQDGWIYSGLPVDG